MVTVRNEPYDPNFLFLEIRPFTSRVTEGMTDKQKDRAKEDCYAILEYRHGVKISTDTYKRNQFNLVKTKFSQDVRQYSGETLAEARKRLFGARGRGGKPKKPGKPDKIKKKW
jgi:hypothetical protein